MTTITGRTTVDLLASLADDGSTQPAAQLKTKYPIFQAGEYAAREVHVEWLIPGVLPKAEICSIFGESGAGKSFFVLSLAVALAAGLPWWGKPLAQRRVVYVAAEGAVGVQQRLKAIAIREEQQLRGGQVELFVIPAQPNLLQVEDVRELIRTIKGLGPVDVVILDTIAQVTPGANENSSEDMGKALAHCKTLHKALGATIVLVGHSGKNQNMGQRGWSGIKGAMDAQIEVTKTATYRAATVAKLKDGKGEGDEYLFKLREVIVDFDLDDSPITSCVVEPILSPEQQQAEKAAAAAHKRTGKAGRHKGGGKYDGFVLEALETLCGSPNKPAHQERVLDEAVRLAKADPTVDVQNPRNSLLKALKSLRGAQGSGSLVVHDASNDHYTLLVPPDPPTL